MKTKTGHLIGCVTEESGEVSQVVGKIIRFGLYDHHPKHDVCNVDLLTREAHDFIAVYQMLMEDLGRDTTIQQDLIDAKKKRVLEYMEYSIKSGHLEEPTLKGDKKNIQKAADFYGESIQDMLFRTRAGLDHIMAGDIDRIVKVLSEQKLEIVNAAINATVGEGWTPCEVMGRGAFKVFPAGREIFSFDGKPLLEFHGVTSGFNDRKGETEVSFVCKRLY